MTSSSHSEPPTAASRVPPRRARWPWIVALCLIVAIAAIAFFWQRGEAQQGNDGARKGAGGPGARPMPVVAVPAKTADVPVYLSGLGSVTPLNTVTVKSRVDGQLMQVLFREGQVVRSAELLAQIDPRPFQAQVGQAEGQLARDMALLKNAQIDLERYRVLFEQDSVAKQQLDTQAALVRQYEGTVKMDQAGLDTAKLQLAYTRVTAPIGGRLGLRQVDPGNIVHASDASGIVVITQLQPIAVVFALPEDNVPAIMKKLQAGEKLPVEGYDRAGRTQLASGTLLTVDNQIDPATGTVKLKAQFANQDYGLFPNQFVNVRMLIDVRRGATVVPVAAVQRGSRGTFVYVVKPDNTVTVRVVKPGPGQGELIAIDEGLVPGEVVVTDGADKLREGARVDIAGRQAAPGDAAKEGATNEADRKGAADRKGGAGRKDGAGRQGGRKGGDGNSGG